MIIKQIISVLKADSALSTLIAGRIYPYHTADFSQACIAYVPVPLEDDKIKETWRLEITIIAKSLETAMEIDVAMRNALITLADEALTNNILSVTLNGGGNLYNYETNTYHIIGYYYVVARK